ncbi:hypothetical protein AAC387_Pa06g3062 [Persea americana]
MHKGYTCLHLDTGRLYISRDVVFIECDYPLSKSVAVPPLPPTSLPLVVNTFPTVQISTNEGVIQTSHGHSASQHMSGSPRPSSPPTNGVHSPLPLSLSGSNHGHMPSFTPPSGPASPSIPTLIVEAELGLASPPQPVIGPGYAPVPDSHPASVLGPGYAPEHAQVATHPMVTRNQDRTKRPKEYPDFLCLKALLLHAQMMLSLLVLHRPLKIPNGELPWRKSSMHLYEMGHGSWSDTSLFFKRSKDYILLILNYVDDIIVTGSSLSLITTLLQLLHSEFAIKDLGALNFFLGIEIIRDHTGLLLSQSSYVRDLLLKTKLDGAKPMTTPMAFGSRLSRFSRPTSFSDPYSYCSTVGALQYLTITLPDIAFAVDKVSQFMQSPIEDHWTAVKRILEFCAILNIL